MRIEREPTDAVPFGNAPLAGVDVARVLGGEVAANMVSGEGRNRARARFETWVRERRLPVTNGTIVVTHDNVAVHAPLYALTGQLATVKAAAVQPVDVVLSVQPRTFTQRLGARFGRTGPVTGDDAFDRRYAIVTSDVEAMRRVLHEDVREALRDVGAWCGIRYDRGTIEILVDDEALAPAHLFDAMELAFELARPRHAAAAYR